MSKWSRVFGTIVVEPRGKGQHAKTFVLNEVLDNLPVVWGSEGNMVWRIFQSDGHNASCNCNEFGVRSNLKRWYDEQTDYVIFVEGSLRDSTYEETLRSFSKWAFRLAKRVEIQDILVRVSGDSHDWKVKSYLFDRAEPFKKAYISPESTDEWHSKRVSTNWRYEAIPTTDCWDERVVNLVPGGNRLAHERDLILGTAYIEEYGEYDHKTGTYPKMSDEAKELLATYINAMYDVVSTTKEQYENL